MKNSKRGMPDVVVCFPIDVEYEDSGTVKSYRAGQFVGIEVKSASGRQSPDQKAAQQQIEAVGGHYWLIKTPEEFEANLRVLLQ